MGFITGRHQKVCRASILTEASVVPLRLLVVPVVSGRVNVLYATASNASHRVCTESHFVYPSDTPYSYYQPGVSTDDAHGNGFCHSGDTIPRHRLVAES
jgi:hypothetical protein